jgi:hypothetical protein
MEKGSSMIKNQLKVPSFLIITSFFLVLFLGCEDDAILEPQTDTGSDGGSYGLLLLENDSDLDQFEENPEIF